MITSESIISFPGGSSAVDRGHAHLMKFNGSLVAIGELDDNDGEQSIDAIETIAAGLIGAKCVSRPFEILHYLPQDHVDGGPVWKVTWHADGGDSSRIGKPTWDPVPPDLRAAAREVLKVVGAVGAYEAESLSARGAQEVVLLEDASLRELLEGALGPDLWAECAELAFGPEATFVEDSGHVRAVDAVRCVGAGRWQLSVVLDMRVVNPDSEIEDDVVDVTSYEVVFEVFDDDFPLSASDVTVAAW